MDLVHWLVIDSLCSLVDKGDNVLYLSLLLSFSAINASAMVCKTPSDTDMGSVPVQMKFDNISVQADNILYTYKLDPNITAISPKKSFVR